MSSDRGAAEFASYYAEMPWLAVPFEDAEARAALSAKYGVRGIPMLVLLDKTGAVVTKNARAKVVSAASSFPAWAD